MATTFNLVPRLPKRWMYAVIAFLFLEAAWFMLLHPLVPSNWIGFVIELVAGAAVGAAIYLAARLIWWLSGQTKHLVLCRIAAVVIALSVGIGVFLAAYELRGTLSHNFHYWVFPGFSRVS